MLWALSVLAAAPPATSQAVAPPATSQLQPRLDVASEMVPEGARDAAVLVASSRDHAVEHTARSAGVRRTLWEWWLWLVRSRGVPIERVWLPAATTEVPHAALQDVEAALAGAVEAVEPGGTLWFVFIGETEVLPSGERALIWDRRYRVGSDLWGLSLDALDARLDASEAEARILIIDGSGPDPGPLPESTPGGTAALLWGGGESWLPKLRPNRQRPALSYLALGAVRGWADANDDGEVTLAEVQTYVAHGAPKGPKPHLRGAGDTVLARGVTERGPPADAEAAATTEPWKRLGQESCLRITSDITDARVHMDRYSPRDPHKCHRIRPGRRRISVDSASDSARPLDREIAVLAGETLELHAPFAPRRATVHGSMVVLPWVAAGVGIPLGRSGPGEVRFTGRYAQVRRSGLVLGGILEGRGIGSLPDDGPGICRGSANPGACRAGDWGGMTLAGTAGFDLAANAAGGFARRLVLLELFLGLDGALGVCPEQQDTPCPNSGEWGLSVLTGLGLRKAWYLPWDDVFGAVGVELSADLRWSRLSGPMFGLGVAISLQATEFEIETGALVAPGEAGWVSGPEAAPSPQIDAIPPDGR